MPSKPKKTLSRPRKMVQQPLSAPPEAIGRVLRRVYPEFMRAIERVVLAGDTPLCPDRVFAIQGLDAFLSRPAKRSSRCRPKAKVKKTSVRTGSSEKSETHLPVVGPLPKLPSNGSGAC